jgi:thioesterase domain-containing protein/acyl carrier protein
MGAFTMNGEVHCEGQKGMAGSMAGSTVAQINASQDETARQLARIWQDLLCVPSISLDQNYFDLGGDSPLAVQLFAQIEKVFKVKLPLATLFEAPTIEELAQILNREAPASGWSPLVPIQLQGSRPPFFCIHGAGGNVLIYRDLSRDLGSDQPFYGLQSRGLDGGCAPLTRIEDMAALYVREIRRVQQHGPYFLGGYCLGGTIAFEVARQLQAKGEQIALLALFDTMNWAKVGLPSIWGKSYYTWQKLLFHSANFIRLDSAGKTEFFSEKVKILRSRIPVWRGMLLGKFRKNAPAEKSESRILGRIWQANDRAAMDYVPQPFAGVVTDFRPTKQYRMFSKSGLKWEQLAEGGQKIVVLPVYPAGMLVEPYVKHLAAALRGSIDEAVRRNSVDLSSRETFWHAR